MCAHASDSSWRRTHISSPSSRPFGVLLDGPRQAVAERLIADERMRSNLVGLEQRHGLVRRLVGGGDAEVEVEVALVAGGPVEAPAHPPAVGPQLLERGA